jgi:CBS domain-containing protein
MDFVSVRVITNDVERLATFWEQLTGLPVTRPVPVFAELRTPAGTIAIGSPATVGMLGNAGPVPGQNRSVFVELRVGDIDATWSESRASSPDHPRDRPGADRHAVGQPLGNPARPRRRTGQPLHPPSRPKRRQNTASDRSLAGAATTAGTHRQATRCSEEEIIVPARTAQAGLAAATPADGIDLNKTRIHDLLTAHPAAIPAPASIRRAARTMVTVGLRQLPVTDGTGWIEIADIADVCGAPLGPPAA